MNKDQKIVIVKEDMTTTEISIPSQEYLNAMIIGKKGFKYTMYLRHSLRVAKIRKIIRILVG